MPNIYDRAAVLVPVLDTSACRRGTLCGDSKPSLDYSPVKIFHHSTPPSENQGALSQAMASHKEHDGSDEHLLHHSGESTSGGYSFLKPALRWTNVDGRRLLFATCACLTAASLFGLLSVMIWTQQSKYQQDSYQQVTLDQEVTHSTVTATHWQTQTETHTMAVTVTAPAQLSIQTSSPVSDAAKWKPEAVLKGHATESFRGNASYTYCMPMNRI